LDTAVEMDFANGRIRIFLIGQKKKTRYFNGLNKLINLQTEYNIINKEESRIKISAKLQSTMQRHV
jgi:hypothetical protein